MGREGGPAEEGEIGRGGEGGGTEGVEESWGLGRKGEA